VTFRVETRLSAPIFSIVTSLFTAENASVTFLDSVTMRRNTRPLDSAFDMKVERIEALGSSVPVGGGEDAIPSSNITLCPIVEERQDLFALAAQMQHDM